MIGFTATKITRSEPLFDAIDKMTDHERKARYAGQYLGDARTVRFGFAGAPTMLTQAVTSATDPAMEEK